MVQWYVQETNESFMVKNRDVLSLNYKHASIDRYVLNFYDIQPPPIKHTSREEKEHIKFKLM
jgi:hypothetical protein